MTSVEKGVLAAAAKKPAMPTSTKVVGFGTKAGQNQCSRIPNAPPAHPPIAHRGAEARLTHAAPSSDRGQDLAKRQVLANRTAAINNVLSAAGIVMASCSEP